MPFGTFFSRAAKMVVVPSFSLIFRAGIPGFAHPRAEKKIQFFFRANARKNKTNTKKHENTPKKQKQNTKKTPKKHQIFLFALTREIKPLAPKKIT